MDGANMIENMAPKGFWAKVPGWIVILITFLLPILFLPVSLVEISILKSVTFLGLLYLALFIWVILKFKDEKFKLSFNLLSLSAVLIPAIYLVSAFFSDNFMVSMFGRDFGFESVIILLSFFAFLLMGTSVLEDEKTSAYTYLALLVSGTIVAIVHILNIFIPSIWPDLGYFLSTTSNTIGKWFDLGVFAGAALILSLISVESIKTGKVFKWILNSIFTLSLLLIIIVGFNELWVVLGIFSLIFFIYFLVIHRVNEEGSKVTIPVLSLITLIVSIIFIIAGPKINGQLQNIFNLEFSSSRPTFMTTVNLVKDSVVENPILGPGPGRFSNVWIANKPIESNLSDLWNIDFRYGYGLVPTLMATTGILGVLSWLFFMMMMLLKGFSSIFKPIKDRLSRFMLVSSFVGSLYMWIMLIIYIPSYTTMFLTFLFTALFFASLHREKLIKVKEISIASSPRHGFIYIFGLIIILLAVIASTYKITSRMYAIVLDRDVNVALAADDMAKAERKAINAINLDMTDGRLLNLSAVYQTQINRLLNNPEIEDEAKAFIYQQLLASTIDANQAAIRFDNGNYGNYMQLAGIFLGLVNENETQAAEQIQVLMDEVKKIYPFNPEIPLTLARVDIASGDNEGARQKISESLELKSNYTDAIFLLSQLEAGEGNIEAAIENVSVAASIQPNRPVVFFQLGLLFYQDDQFTKAVPAFERAVILSPLYSNAKYFLALSYYQEGREEEAILQFEDLKLLNPENTEIQVILNNLQNGNSPFYGLGEDLDEPEEREEPPLDNDEIDEGDDTGITE